MRNKIIKFFTILVFFIFSIGCYYSSINTPLEEKKKIPVVEIPDTDNNTTMIIGDSIAAGVSIYGTLDWWSPLLDNGSIQNIGVSGAQIDYFLQAYKTIQADTVIIIIGFNNMKHLDQSIDDIIIKYQRLLSIINATNIYCVSIPPMNHSMSNEWFPDGDVLSNNRIKSINDGIELLCQNNGYIFINIFSMFLGVDGECQTKYTIDGVHPSGLGYEILRQELKKN